MIASSSPAQHFFTAFGAGLAAFGVFFLLVGWIIRRTLAGNTSQIPVLIAEMNAHGTEYTQSYHLKKSNSTYGGEVNAGGGGGAELSDGGSSACYDPPRVRQNGGPWTTTTWNSNQTC